MFSADMSTCYCRYVDMFSADHISNACWTAPTTNHLIVLFYLHPCLKQRRDASSLQITILLTLIISPTFIQLPAPTDQYIGVQLQYQAMCFNMYSRTFPMWHKPNVSYNLEKECHKKNICSVLPGKHANTGTVLQCYAEDMNIQAQYFCVNLQGMQILAK